MPQNDNKTRVTMLTDAYRIKGYIDLLPGARITDFFESPRDFVAVTEAEVFEVGNNVRHVLTAPFLDVSRRHIQIITPSD